MGQKWLGPGPSDPADLTTKKYVDDRFANLVWTGTQSAYDGLANHTDFLFYAIKD